MAETPEEGINIPPNRIKNNPQTLLGTTFDLTGDSSYTGLKLVKKTRNKIKEIPFPPRASPSMASNIANTYIIPAGEWAHLTSKITIDTTDSLDKAILKRI